MVKVALSGDIVILTPEEKLTFGASVEALRSEVNNHLDKGRLKFVFDLQHVSFMDSAGLGILITAVKYLNNKDGKMALCTLSKQAKKALDMAHLNLVFQVYETRQQAINALQ